MSSKPSSWAAVASVSLLVTVALGVGLRYTAPVPVPESVLDLELADTPEAPEAPSPLAVAPQDYEDLGEGLLAFEVVEGSGSPAQPGSLLELHYLLWLPDGTLVEASRARGQTLRVVLGAGDLLPGLERGVEGLRPGGQRQLILPAHLALGSQGAPPEVPPDTDLLARVTLVEVGPARVVPEAPASLPEEAFVRLPSGVAYVDLEVGHGPPPVADSRVTLDYSAWAEGGQRLDSTLARSEPVTVQLGRGEAPQAWEEVLQSMRVGGRRQILAPRALALAPGRDLEALAPDALLVYELQLHSID